MSQGVALIARERKRQITEEGWDAAHDQEHDDGSLARVAALYALPIERSKFRAGSVILDLVQILWPRTWSMHWWKPTPHDRLRELTKAGALIAAEIDRLIDSGVTGWARPQPSRPGASDFVLCVDAPSRVQLMYRDGSLSAVLSVPAGETAMDMRELAAVRILPQ